MPSSLRLLFTLSILAILVGALIKINHLNFSGSFLINGGIVGLLIYIVGSFIFGEIKKRKSDR